MRRFFSWVFGLPVAVILVLFAIANRRSVEVSFDPLTADQPFASLEAPLWAVLFFGIFCGLVAGWIWAWVNQGKWRRSTRDARTELAALRAENARLQREKEARELSTHQSASSGP